MPLHKRRTKRKVLICAAAVAAAGALLPLASLASAGEESLQAELDMGRTTTWWSNAAFVLKNGTSSAKKDWTLEFEVSAGTVQVNSSWTTSAEQQDRHVVLKPTEHGAVAAGARQRIDLGIQGDGKAVPEITGCKLDGEPFSCGGKDDGPDTEAPTAPGNLTGKAETNGTISLKWSPSTDNRKVVFYEVFDKGKKIFATSGDVTEALLTAQNAGIRPEQRYDLSVKAVDAAGNVSTPSNRITVTTPADTGGDHRPPTAPTSLEAKATGATTARLTWKKATGTASPVAGYRVYQKGVAEPVRTTGPDTLDADIAGLKASTAYAFTVKAFDAKGNVSPASNEATVTTDPSDEPAPGGSAPTNLEAKTWAVNDGPAVVHYLGLTWDVPKGQGDILRYEVYLDGKFSTTVSYYDPATATGVPPGPAKGGKALAEITLGGEPGATHKVKVRAQLGNGSWGEFSAEKSVTAKKNPS
ncbi:fibronectin type III domain-containing protein [Streptomyces sp. NPDC001262]|uniref:fibronectin type III domain-containing protein n=1 Tax=Streptomyces sp. NPDC001262 TaxID=3364552 RepID=UPI0036B4828E